jgi:phosphate transport system substrate-binding protein
MNVGMTRHRSGDRAFHGFAWSLALVAASMGAGCISKSAPTTGDGTGTKSASEAVASTINVEGSSTVFLISQAMANEFEKASPHKDKVSLGRSGTSGGYKKFVVRQCDLWNASRPIADKEKAELKEKGIDWLELEVGIDGLSIAVNPQNDWCHELTVGQLRKIWAPDSTFNKWSDLNPEWPDKEIECFGADTDSGTFEYFTEVIVGKKGSSRVKYQAASDDKVLVQGVAGSKYALGYIPFGYCVQAKDKVKVLNISPTIDGTPEPAVEPTNDSILSGKYHPLSRPLFVYANRETLKRREIADFLKFTISAEAQPLVSKRGFVQITEERRKEMVERLEAALKAASAPEAKAEAAAKPEAK